MVPSFLSRLEAASLFAQHVSPAPDGWGVGLRGTSSGDFAEKYQGGWVAAFVGSIVGGEEGRGVVRAGKPLTDLACMDEPVMPWCMAASLVVCRGAMRGEARESGHHHVVIWF